MTNDSTLASARLLLEPLLPTHAPALYSGLSAPELYEYLDEGPPKSVDLLEERYNKLASRKSPTGDQLWLNWALRERSTSQYVGYVQATVDPPDTALIAYVVFRNEWHKGYGREAVRRVLWYLRECLSVKEVSATVDPHNERSIALLLALNFEQHVDGGAKVGVDQARDIRFRRKLSEL